MIDWCELAPVTKSSTHHTSPQKHLSPQHEPTKPPQPAIRVPICRASSSARRNIASARRTNISPPRCRSVHSPSARRTSISADSTSFSTRQTIPDPPHSLSPPHKARRASLSTRITSRSARRTSLSARRAGRASSLTDPLPPPSPYTSRGSLLGQTFGPGTPPARLGLPPVSGHPAVGLGTHPH